MADLTAADSTLASAFRDTPTRLLPLFETAIREALGIALGYEPGEEAADARADLSSLPHFQLVIRWDHPSDEDRGLTQIRQITVGAVCMQGRLVVRVQHTPHAACGVVGLGWAGSCVVVLLCVCPRRRK